jgi:methionyl-tRNA formyltransferase
MREKIVFFGTSHVCLPFLELLVEQYDIPLVITQPDAYGGRNRKKVIVPPVKTFALEHNLDILQPETLKDDDAVQRITSLEPVLGVVISYGKLIPKRIFSIPAHNTVNVHFSLLPQYRGAAPVQRGLMNGDTVGGISIFQLAKKMDAGDIWAQKEMNILPDDTTETLWERMSREGAPFLVDTIEAIINGKISKSPQDHEKATCAPMVRKDEGCVNWNLTAQQLYNRFRAFTPWPGLTCKAGEKVFKLTQLKVTEQTHRKKPGDVLQRDKKSMTICCGEGTVLEILEIQPQGKKPMSPYCYCMGNVLPDCLA